MSDSPDTREAEPEVFDLARLERAVARLVTEQRALRSENELLRQALSERDGGLEQRLTLQEQRRTDALKRIDDLIAQVEGFAMLAEQTDRASQSARAVGG